MAQMSHQTKEQFEEAHIAKIWEELNSRFGFNLKFWIPEFNKYLDTQRRDVGILEAFFSFGHDRINPILNAILGRRQGYPTLTNLIEYVVTGKPKK